MASFSARRGDLVPELLSFADLGAGEMLFDLGCGDARVLIDAATRLGAQGVGYEIDPLVCARARAAIASAGVGDRVTVHEADASSARIEGRGRGVFCSYLSMQSHAPFRNCWRASKAARESLRTNSRGLPVRLRPGVVDRCSDPLQ